MARSIASRLDDYLAACPPFDWRTHNCGHFAAGWLQVAEGAAPPAPVLACGAAYRLSLRRLQVDLAGYMTHTLQRQPVPPSSARPGDLLLWACNNRQGLAICTGRTAAGISPAGVQHMAMQHATQAWPVRHARGAA